MRIGLLLIATNKYKEFVIPFLKSADEFFFPGEDITVYLFTDGVAWDISGLSARINVEVFNMPSYKFPHATLYRYNIFTLAKHSLTMPYLFYSDIDMRFEGTVGNEILPQGDRQLVVTQHPGFFKGGGSWCTNVKSTAFTPEDFRHTYYAGGFQGGKRSYYLEAARILSAHISFDEERGILAEWHDESHWNYYTSHMSLERLKILSPSYCMVEQVELRTQWGIDHLPVKLVALAKDHTHYRS